MPSLMKGHRWADRRDARRRDGTPVVLYPVLVEPKIDEIRVEVLWDRMAGRWRFLSYAGKSLHNLDAFSIWFDRLALVSGHNRFDCGVLVAGIFDATYRYVRSSRGVPPDLADAPVMFHLYDIPDYQTALYVGRRSIMREWIACVENIVQLPAVMCYDHNTVEAEYTKLRNAGYEGAMVKNPYYTYAAGKRTDDWLKMKPDQDADGVIVSLVPAVCGKDQPELGLKVGDELGRIGSVRLRMADGSEAVPHGIPHALGADMLANPQNYLGETAEFNYMERDRQGGYRHPVFKRVREATA